MLRTILTSTAALILASGTAFAQDWNADDWDVNDDDILEEEEFREGAETDLDLFGLFDEDDDDVLTEDEFYAGTYRQYDLDRDEKWSSEETEDFMSSVRGAEGISQ